MPLDTRYRVVFAGDVAEGCDTKTVKEKLASLLRIELSRIEQMFNGKTVSIKKNVDHSTAQKYSDALLSLGAVCKIMPMLQSREDEALPQHGQSSELGQTLIWVGDLFAKGSETAKTGKSNEVK